MIPWLRAGGEDVHHRAVDRWVVQASRLQAEDIRKPFQFRRHLASADRAKATFDRRRSEPACDASDILQLLRGDFCNRIGTPRRFAAALKLGRNWR